MSDEATSNKCEHCITGHLHSGTAVGSEGTLGGLPCYTAHGCKPGDKDFAVIILTDVFGWQLPNVRLIADKMAAGLGCSVFVPDILGGDAISGPIDREKFPAWLGRHTPDVTMPLVRTAISAVKQEYAVKKVAVQGYCFGGRYCALTGAEGLVDAYGVAHPSFIKVEDFSKLAIPGFFACAETDSQFPPAMADEMEAVLNASGVPHEFRRYPGTTHGFAVRGSEDDGKVVAARDDALAGVLVFFARHVGQLQQNQ